MLTGQLLTDRVEERIARVFERIRDVERHGRVVVVAAEGLSAVFVGAGAGNVGVAGDDTFLQTRDGGHHLKGGARRVHTRGCTVYLRMAVVRLDGGVVFVVVCQVVGRVGRHREHLARVRVERNSRAALAVGRQIAFQRFLGDFLQVKVNRGDNIVARFGSRSGGLLGNSRTAKVGLHRAGACRAVQVGLERALQTGLADEIAHLVACLVLVRAAVFVGTPLVGGQGADRAEQVRGGGGVVLADGFALDFNALKIRAVLLDIGDQVHRHIVRERVGRLIAEADRAHAVIDADHRAGIRKREVGRHAEVFLHIGAHGIDKLGRGDQFGRIHLRRLINGVAVLVGLGGGLARLLSSVYGRRNRIQTERLGAVLHITR